MSMTRRTCVQASIGPPTPPRRRLMGSQNFASRQCCAPAPSSRPRSHSGVARRPRRSGSSTHQFAFLSPSIGTIAAGWAVGLTTFAAVVGRVVTGFVVDRFDRRVVTSLNFGVQAFGMGLLAASTDRSMLYPGCVIFGIGVGNATTLPGLIVQQEFPKQHFARLISIVVAINQFTFAFGPTLLAQLHHLEGPAQWCCWCALRWRSRRQLSSCHPPYLDTVPRPHPRSKCVFRDDVPPDRVMVGTGPSLPISRASHHVAGGWHRGGWRDRWGYWHWGHRVPNW